MPKEHRSRCELGTVTTTKQSISPWIIGRVELIEDVLTELVEVLVIKLLKQRSFL
jgi:hypothetical protein